MIHFRVWHQLLLFSFMRIQENVSIARIHPNFESFSSLLQACTNQHISSIVQTRRVNNQKLQKGLQLDCKLDQRCTAFHLYGTCMWLLRHIHRAKGAVSSIRMCYVTKNQSQHRHSLSFKKTQALTLNELQHKIVQVLTLENASANQATWEPISKRTLHLLSLSMTRPSKASTSEMNLQPSNIEHHHYKTGRSGCSKTKQWSTQVFLSIKWRICITANVTSLVWSVIPCETKS